MALQPLPRMRMARPRMGGTLGQIAPVDLNSPNNVNASADNDAAAQRQQAWNTAAAAQYQQMKQQQSAVDVGNINNEANRQALAKGFGYSPDNAPTFGQLYSQFLSQPKPIQVGMYKKGFAPFLNDDEDSGVKDIQQVSDKLDAIHQQHTSDVVQGVIKGDVGYDIDPISKQPNWWVKRSIPNPADPTGKAGLPPIEVHEPANPIVKAYLARAVNSGIMPDPITGKLADTNSLPTPNARMSEDQFQQVLNARAGQPDATDKFQAILDQRAGINQPQSQVAQFPPQYNQPSAPQGDSSTLPSQLTPASTAALAARSGLLGKLGSTGGFTDALDLSDPNSLLSNAKDAIGQTYGTDLINKGKSAYDYVSAFLSGQGNPQGSIAPATDVIPQTPLSSPQFLQSPRDNALAAMRAKQQPQQDDNNSNVDLSSIILGGMN